MTVVLSATEYRLLVEHSPVMVWRAGLDAKCDYFNDRWLAFTGRSIGQEMGDGWTEGVHPDDLDRSVADYLDHFQRREPFEMEYRLRRNDGVHRWIFDRGVPFTDEAGEFSGFIGSCVDVDDRRRAQAERERQGQEQIALARQFSQWVLSIVSHDIRNPLAAIAGSARTLAVRASDDAPLHNIAERITRNADRILHIVRDLLDFSRDRYGSGIPIVLAPADMDVICRDVVDEVVCGATDRNKIIVECTGDASGTWDAHRMAQAVSNLLGNAVQHSPAGTPVHVNVRGERDQVVVEVHNEGAIPSDRMTTLFEAFRSSAHRAAHHEGLGLGLFIARAIARVHHGNIEVDSAPESGTTFRVALPRDGGSATSSSTSPPVAQ